MGKTIQYNIKNVIVKSPRKRYNCSNQAGNDVTNCFRSEATAKKNRRKSGYDKSILKSAER